MAKRPNVRKEISVAGRELSEFMKEHLSEIAENLIDQVMRASKGLTPSQSLKAIAGIEPRGIAAYRSELMEAMTLIAQDALAGARKQVPRAKKVELAEEKIPPKLLSKLKTRNQLLIGKQIGDLKKVIEFAYLTSEDTTDSEAQIREDLEDSAVGWLDGTAMVAGGDLTAASVINSAREAFFWDEEVLEEIEAFEFVNGDPVTPICDDLAGTTFAKDDPNAFRYTPPLHWNCKSSVHPILNGNLGRKEITKLKPSKSELENEIQFSECLAKIYESSQTLTQNESPICADSVI